MPTFTEDTEKFVHELDAAIAAHLDWTRRVLRCAVLHSSPGDDVLAADAHCRCRFGLWFNGHLEAFQAMDPAATAQVLAQHERMHDAVRSLCQALLSSGRGEAVDLDRFEATQSALVTELAAFKTRCLSQAARIDELTGLPLRYGLEAEFEAARALAARSGQLLVLMLVDVDHFKRVNDGHGHAVGDLALRHVAQVLRAAARRGEPVFRFGGEEFLLLLHTADLASAEAAAERIQQALRGAPLVLDDGSRLALTVSAGLCSVTPDLAMPAAIAVADRALYVAKHAGRDRWLWGSV